MSAFLDWYHQSHLGTVLTAAWLLYLALLSVWVILQKRSPVATLAWILSLALLPYIGFWLFYFFGPNRMTRQQHRRLRSQARVIAVNDLQSLKKRSNEYSVTLTQLIRLGIRASHLPMSTATDVHLLVGGATTFDSIFTAIRAAKRQVHLEYYIFEPDQTGTALRDLLIEKAREGVVVRLLIDALGSKRITHKFLQPLKEAGGEYAFFHEVRFARRLRPVTNYRSHRKIVVCDSHCAFTGGVNITDTEHEHLRSDAYHDVHLRLTGAAAFWLDVLFIEDWVYSTNQPPSAFQRGKPPSLAAFAPGNYPVQVLASGPDTPWEAIHRAQIHAIENAKERVWLTTPYFVPSEPALMALTNAALRGVDVRVLIPRMSDSRVVTYAARSYFEELQQAGAKIWEYQDRMLHSKTLIIDQWCGMVGTANFDNRSFSLNYEVCTLVYDSHFVQQLAQQFDLDLKASQRVLAPRPLSFGSRLAEASARLLSPVL